MIWYMHDSYSLILVIWGYWLLVSDVFLDDGFAIIFTRLLFVSDCWQFRYTFVNTIEFDFQLKKFSSDHFMTI